MNIKRLRGFDDINIGPFGDINLFVGGNGIGKSTVIEAIWLLLGLPSHVPALASLRNSSAKWFFRAGRSETIEISAKGTPPQHVRLGKEKDTIFVERQQPSPPSRSSVEPNGGRVDALGVHDQVRMIRWDIGTDPLLMYSEARRTGRAQQVVSALRSALPWIEDLEILVDGKVPYLAGQSEGSYVPLSEMGSGAAELVRVATNMGASPVRCAFTIEEPEVHQHPKTIEALAAVIATAASGLQSQVFIATHSIELVRSMIELETGLECCFFRMARASDGRVHAIRNDKARAKHILFDIQEDLR